MGIPPAFATTGSELGVAKAFLGARGKRTLFEVTPVRAVGISSFSAFTGEEEYILAPGTRLKVTGVPPGAAACAR
ncbi:hypothetical protein LO772_07105 [Yinghuangia sp. ASG 101]|uniref:hypothetical protein n=1 Tax=Yinghuangia sp. ASG 101 TaxID=2896848 RepID=UPI001E4BF36F|nr:hypothetical protein [Yinghuangia sp. ASG 101]UGQ13369.1 hypothetical protein LO772_07105 [Yinghuangia sp. ASG 101]